MTRGAAAPRVREALPYLGLGTARRGAGPRPGVPRGAARG